MVFRPPKKQPGFADLKGILAQSKDTDNALYQTVQILIERLTQLQGNLNSDIAQIKQATEDKSGVVPGSSKFYDVPLTDGHVDECELIFALGECIIVQVPNVS